MRGSVKKQKDLLDSKSKELIRAKEHLHKLKVVRDSYVPSFKLERIDSDLHKTVSLVIHLTSEIEAMERELYGSWAPKKKNDY